MFERGVEERIEEKEAAPRWQRPTTRAGTTRDLWGFCSSCYYADVCCGGCTWTTHSLLGRAGNNPYCHYRVLRLAGQGLRERIVKAEEAPGLSFDYGRFDLILEPLDGGPGPRTIQVAPPARAEMPRTSSDRLPPTLPLCRNCNQYVFPSEETCPHCGCDIAAAAMAWEASIGEVRRAADALEQILRQQGAI